MTRRGRMPLRRVGGSVVAGVLLAGVVGFAAAQDIEPTVPKPRGFVSDYVGVVDAATRSSLDSAIGELQAKTGAEIAVVVVRTTAPLSAFDYAMKIAEAWKPGRAGKDNGIVFLVATEDREMFILTGYGVEGALPDGKVGEIRDRIVVPAFRRGDYSGGIRKATLTMAGIIAADAGVELTGVAMPSRGRDVRRELSAIELVFGLFVLLVMLVIVIRNPWLLLAVQRPRHRGGFGTGGFGGGLGGGGFGGFGGGGFGGGGAGGRW